MDQGDIYRASSSLRRNRSIYWWKDGSEALSNSARRKNDDEEALKWAALEKLPTYDSMARGLLVGSGGETSAVNIRGIGFQERKDLFERLLKSADEDNDKFLMKLRDRIDRVGIQLPAIEVRFEHPNVSAEAYVGISELSTYPWKQEETFIYFTRQQWNHQGLQNGVAARPSKLRKDDTFVGFGRKVGY